MIKKCMYLILIPYLLFGADSNLTNPFPEATVVKDNLPQETNSSDMENWNSQDWNSYFVGKGADDSVAGNAKLMMGNTNESKVAYSQNPNLLTTDSVKADPNLKDSEDIKGWDSHDQADVLANSLNNTYVSVLDISDKIECYITRDISFQYKCESTGLIYGGEMQKSGRDARLKCDQDCYEQKPCVNVNAEAALSSATVSNLTCDFSVSNSCETSAALDTDKIIKDLTLNFEDTLVDNNSTNKSKEYLITILLTHKNGTVTSVIKNFRRSFTTDESTMNIGDTASKIDIKVAKFEENNNTIANLSNIKVNYKKNDKYICRYLQNMNDIDGKSFANNCASGNIQTFEYQGEEYKICNDGMLGADNSDGTFSNEQSCLSVCKIPQSCVPSYNVFTTNALKTFREGCIEGQAGCSNTNEDCKVARLKGDTVIDEAVFDATANKTTTIQSGIQIKGVIRPRIDPGADLDFERRNQEEWKDEAFKDMASNNKYSSVISAIGENTQEQNAYSIHFLSGATYGVSGGSIRTLYWKLKPPAFDVNNDATYYLYSILVADIGYHDYSANGTLEQKKKQIWYIKTSADDTFKAIKIGENLGYDGLDENNNTQVNTIASSALENKTFTSNAWYPYSTSSYAEYFTTQKFENNDLPYWRFPIVSNLGNLVYKLQGMVRSVTRISGGYDQKYYSGNFDGTGDGLLTFSVYTYYSPNRLSYDNLFSKIDDKEMKKIYKQGEEYLYTQKTEGDADGNNTVVQIFQYGTSDKTSLYTIIHPKKEDIGKKGFIFVFMQ
ncbi:hypothetical protein [Sulfurimonas sp.]